MKHLFLHPKDQNCQVVMANKISSFTRIKRAILFSIILLQLNMLLWAFVSFGQEITLSGKVVNSNSQPVAKVFVSLKSTPEIFCYSDESGNFSFAGIGTTIRKTNQIYKNERIRFIENRKLLIEAQNESLQISIIDIMGRFIKIIAHKKNLSGYYEIYPALYVQDMPKGIYFVKVNLGNYQKGYRFNNFNQILDEKGLHNISPSDLSPEETVPPALKSYINSEDTIVFEHDFYKTTQVYATNLNEDIGIIEMENFGDYSLATNTRPDKAILYNVNGTVLNLLGKDSSEFNILFSPYSIFKNKITIKAIPVDELNGLAPGVELISAVHLEPGGTQFNIPAIVNIVMKDITISDSLVVFLYDDVTDKTYYIPYFKEGDWVNSIGFSLPHFSTIGIGYQSDFPEESGDPITTDDFISEINYHLFMGEEVPDDLFTVWFENIVLKAIDAVTNIENLQDAMSEVGLLGTYINYVGKDISEFSFYDELTSSLTTKINYIFKGINDECESVTDPCTKRDIARIAITFVGLTQQLAGIEPLNIEDICNGEVLEIISDFRIEAMINLNVSETVQIPYILYNVHKEKIDSEEIDPEFEWYSEDPIIATVNQDGIITGKSKGTVKVFAKFCDIKRYVLVNVNGDHSYCYSDTNIYTGTVNLYHYVRDDYNKSFVVSDITIRITANMKEGTYTGFVFGYLKGVHYSYSYEHLDWLYDGTSYTFYNYPIHPSHRQGKLTCSSHSYALDNRIYSVMLYPESGIIKATDNHVHGIGVLIRH